MYGQQAHVLPAGLCMASRPMDGQLSIPASLIHKEKHKGQRGTHWQVELSSKPGTCLTGKMNSTTPLTSSSASLMLTSCNPHDDHQVFEFVEPSSRLSWAANPHLCLDEEYAGILPCIPQWDKSRRQVFTFTNASQPTSSLLLRPLGLLVIPRGSPWR